MNAWCQRAISKDSEDFIDQWTRLTQRINDLRMRVTTYNLPFLSLSATTPSDVAVKVFIKMNTSSVRLTAFDIVVAQLEEATQQSLHDLIAGLRQRAPALEQYDVPQDVVLAVAALRQDRPAQEATYLRLDKKRLVEQWPSSVEGIAWAISFLEEERIFDGRRLPTSVVLPVLPALHEVVPNALDALGVAKALLRKYLWRAFSRTAMRILSRDAPCKISGGWATIERGEARGQESLFSRNAIIRCLPRRRS